ncbi:transposase [Microbispora sp. NBC_01189]|uniref:transposase n=1 Tax=Microbispora sp. NBC_01189 TaxID=2903583 RepID=UPI003A8FDF82
MAAPRKYPDELRERATRMAVEARRDPDAATGAIKRIADQLGVHPEALRMWVPGRSGGPVRGTRSASAGRSRCAPVNTRCRNLVSTTRGACRTKSGEPASSDISL